MIFYSFFKTLVGKEVTVELKNDLAITGVLHSVDQYLNIKLTEISIGEPERHPQARRRFFSFLSLFSSSSSPAVCSQKESATHPQKRKNDKQLATVKNVFIRGSVVRYVKVREKEEEEEESFEVLRFSSSTSTPSSRSLFSFLFSFLSLHHKRKTP